MLLDVFRNRAMIFHIKYVAHRIANDRIVQINRRVVQRLNIMLRLRVVNKAFIYINR